MSNNKNQDYSAYLQAGLKDVYEKGGDYSIFMVCDKINRNAFCQLPHGYSFRLCRPDELEIWKRVVAEEQYVDVVTDYFNKVYAKNKVEFFRRCLFVCDANDTPVASCYIWQSYGQINTVGWFRVLPEYEGNGLGRALLSKLFETVECPLYLHTHPTSLCALKLYSDFGFAIITNEGNIGYRSNDIQESLPYLKQTMPETEFAKLRFVEIDHTLHEISFSSEQSEF